jgi:hypothetical protein
VSTYFRTRHNAKNIFLQLFQLSTFSILIEFGGQLIFRGGAFYCNKFYINIYIIIIYTRVPIGELIKLIIDFVYFVYFFESVYPNRGSTLTADRMLPRQDEAFSRPTEYPMLWDGVLSQPTEYLLRLRKHYNGRQSTRSCKMEYSHGRQSTCYNRGNTVTADRILPQFAQASSRPTEYLMPRNGILSQPT